MQETIEAGYDAFVSDGDADFGVVREVFPDSVLVYVEKAGDFVVPRSAIDAVRYYKVIFDCGDLDYRLRTAIGHTHEARRSLS